MQLPRSQREEKHDTLCEELLRERAAVLSRAGMAVEDAIDELTKLDYEIQIKEEQLKSLKLQDQSPHNLNKQQALVDEINVSIDQFNTVHNRAQLKYYYLIVTREALGLRRHDRIQEIYIIPAKRRGHSLSNG
ncbi:MAG: hypothetical protein AB2L12_17240 [Smithellaceae bacterium]